MSAEKSIMIRTSDHDHDDRLFVEEGPSFLFAPSNRKNSSRRDEASSTFAHRQTKPPRRGDRSKPFDREEEQAKLLQAYKTGERIVLISGYSGTGKTTLALTLPDVVANDDDDSNGDDSNKGMYFIKGKFDQVERKEPYLAFIAAFTEWVEMITVRSTEVTRIREASSRLDPADALLLMDTIPALEKVLTKPTNSVHDATSAGGVQQSTTTATTHSSSNRFLFALRYLIRAVVSSEYPVVLLLDDLQWADLASLALVEALASAGIDGFTLLGTCRDNEVPAATHPLASTLRLLEEKNVHIAHIPLGNHSSEAVTRYVSEFMNLPEDQVKPLAERVFAVTAGNMLFMLHFMEFLSDKGWLYREEDEKSDAVVWKWDEEKLHGEVFADNVMVFVIGKIRRLPTRCQGALTIAASIGARVEESVLGLTIELDVDVPIRDVLAPAVEHGFLSFDGQDYVFVHDRIQQAAYSLVPEQDREAFHLGLGRRLWERSKGKDLDKILFVLVGQMNLGSALMVDTPEAQYDLASLNLRAGKRVIASSAFDEGALYLQKGLALLQGKDHWRERYELTLDLFDSAAEVEYCRANFDETDRLVQEVLLRARTFHDRLRAHATQIYLLGTQEKMLEAMDLGFALLKKLGERFPKKATGLSIVIDIYRTKFMLRGKRSQDLLKLPLMDDIEKITAMQVLNLLLMYAYFVSPDFLPLLMFRMIHLTVRHGLCAVSCVGFEGYAMVLIGALGEIKEGTRYGKLGMELLHKFQAKEWVPRVNCLYYGMVEHWSQPLNATGLLEGYRCGMETGDVEYAMAVVNLYVMNLLNQGRMPLDQLEAEVRHYSAQVRAYKQDVTLVLTLTTLQFVLNLRGQSEDPVVLTGEVMDQQAVMGDAMEMNNITRICNIHNLRLALGCIFGDFEVAIDAARNSSNVEEVMISLYDVVVHHTFTGLAAVSMARRSHRRKHKAMARKHFKKVTRWAKFSPRNTLHKSLLLEAELMALSGNNVDGATRLFRSAIEEARKGGFLHMQAISIERMALFLNHCGNKPAAMSLYEESQEVYRQWGAIAKMNRQIYSYDQ